MDITLEEKKIMSVMKKFAETNGISQIMGPFEIKLKKLGRGNSGYGSSMHDYDYYVTEYYSEDGNLVLIKNDDRNQWADTKWELSESFTIMYDFFGEELFEKFFFIFNNIDITEKGNKKYNWIFGIEGINGE